MRSAIFQILFVLLLILIPIIPKGAFAGELAPTFLRLERQSVSTSTGGMLCATTPASDNGVENQVQIIFPTGFNVSSTASNWTVTTADLPGSSTAWPGIGTATSVNGQTVTFPSSNLSTSTEYCFNFSSSNTLTNPTSTGSYQGTIRTRNSSNSTIDSIGIGLSIVSSDGILVSATVPANPTDFSSILELISPSNNYYHTEGTILAYKLTYGSYLAQNSSINVEAQWNLGTIYGELTPTEDIIDYVVGSASYGYSGTPPVIDITNRKINWVISNFPGLTLYKNVTFQLRLNSNTSATLPVTFTVDGRVYGPGTQTPDSTVASIFQKSSYITPTPTPSCAPGTCPTATPAPTGIPTPTTPPTPKPKIIDIEIRRVDSTSASIYVTTARPSTIRIDIGKDIRTLKSLGFSKNPSTQHLINLERLDPATRYYFRVTATDREAVTVSDLYVLQTALPSPLPQILTQTLIITSQDVILTASSSPSRIIIPKLLPISFKFNVDKNTPIKSINAILRNNNVLGMNSYDSDLNATDSVPVAEVANGQYIGKLSSKTSGLYKLVLQIQDYNGNLAEQKIADILVSEPFQIIDSNTKSGIENAKVTLYLYNSRLRIFELIGGNTTPIKNPVFSEPDGSVSVILPEGKYRAGVSALSYKSTNVDFEISPTIDSYPTIALVPLPFTLITFLKNYAQIAIDVSNSLSGIVDNFRSSFRFFDLTAFILIAFFVCLSTIAISKRLSIPIEKIPYFAYYHILILFKKPTHSFLIHGSARSSESNDLSGVLVYITTISGRIITHSTTNLAGEFFAKISENIDVKVLASKKKYKTTSIIIKKKNLNDKLAIELTKTEYTQGFGSKTIISYAEFVLSSLFETFLVLTLVFEILFTFEFGIAKTLPFIVISTLNVILWTGNMRVSKS